MKSKVCCLLSHLQDSVLENRHGTRLPPESRTRGGRRASAGNTGEATRAQRKPSKAKSTRQGALSRWRRSKTWRSPASPHIHQNYIYMWNNIYRTPTECWQKTSDFPKGKKLPMYLGRAKEKRKNRDKRIGMGPALLGGSCKGGKVSTH